jgi:uncharacterized protein (DUF1330 family)
MVHKVTASVSALGFRLLLMGLFVVSLLAPNNSLAQTPTNPNPGYLLVVGKTTDRAKIGAYAASLPPIYASLDGYYLAIGAPGRGVTWLEGPWTDRSVIFAKFPTRAGADAFWWGEAYRTAIRKRDNAGVFSVVAIEGTSPTPFEGAGAGFLIVMTGSIGKGADEQGASDRATASLVDGVNRSGGQLINSPGVGQFMSMEGDTVFDRFVVASWPSVAARDAYLASADAAEAKRLRQLAGISAVASANGVPRNQAPTAVSPK